MEMKLCKYCGREKPAEDFGIAAIIEGKTYRRLKCSSCKTRGQLKRKQRVRLWLEDYKKARVCERCGFSDYRALTFHHRDRAEKEFAIADMIGSGRSLENIRREISKCSLLCANCHAIEHYQRPRI